MTRRITHLAPLACLPFALLIAAGCSVTLEPEDSSSDAIALSDTKCAEADANCDAPPPCDDGDPACPCDPADAACATSVPNEIDCEQTAKKLAGLLAAAQSCNVAVMNPIQCASFVPATSGCSVPVASPGSDETKAYLELFAKYADACPLPVPACPNPNNLVTECTQDPNIDGLFGACSIVGSLPSSNDTDS
jgi:hypothetical protein